MVGCAVAACHNHHRTTRSKGITYHSFPRDPKLAKIWMIKCRRKDTLNISHGRVCSDHFLPTDYEDDMKNRLLGLKERKILKRGAVPSLKLSSCDDGDERTSSRTERIRKRNILQRALRRLKSLSPKRIDDASKLECSSKVNHQLHSSGTSSREEEKNKDHIPLEPTIEIKEEPLDYNPTPSTSTDAANEEFILPHEENTWTPPDPVVEPQFTLSVASLASSNDPETSESEQVRKKRKVKTSTFVPSTNGPEVRQQSPVYNFGEVSNPGSSKEPRKDQFDVFGEYIAAKLRSLDRRSCSYAQKAIGDIIFEAEMGKYLNMDSESKDLKNCAS